MKWDRIRDMHYVSDCGRYEIRGHYAKNFWNGWHAATGRLVAASGDKDFVKDRCAADAELQPHTANERVAA